MCVAACPGLAITLVRPNDNGDEAIVLVPYELFPHPVVGERVIATDGLDRALCEGVVASCLTTRDCNGTTIVVLRVSGSHAERVEGFRRKETRHA